MRATDDAVAHDDRQRAALLDEFQYFTGDGRVIADVALIELPVAHFPDIRVLGWHNPNRNLCRPRKVRTVESDSGDRPAPHPPSSFLAQAPLEPIPDHPMCTQPIGFRSEHRRKSETLRSQCLQHSAMATSSNNAIIMI
jgi:hypothetical protein